MTDFVVSRRTILQSSLASAAILALPGLAACSSNSKKQASGSRTLVYTDSDTPPSFDTDTNGGTDTGENIVANCYGGDMVGFNTVNASGGARIADILATGVKGGISNGFAEAVEFTPDLKTFTIRLRSDVTSAYGNKLTADDVIWSFQRNLALGQTGAFMVNAMGITKGSQLTKVDANTVRFELPAPSPLFLKIDAAKLYSGLTDSTVAKQHATTQDPWSRNWLSQNTAGFGPYTLEAAEKGQYVHLKANPSYGTKPAYDRVVWQATPTAANRMALLQSGQADIAVKLTPPQLKQAEQTRDLAVTSYVSNQMKGLQLNTKYPPLADPRVRRAIAYAMPYDEILASVYLGTATSTHSPLPPAYHGYTDQYWDFSTNVDKARALISAAGVGKFSMTLTYSDGQYDDPLIAPIVASALNAIGISVQLDGLPASTFTDKFYGRKGQAYLQTVWPFVADPGYALGVYWKSTAFLNVGSWSNKEYDALIEKMLVEIDPQATVAYAKKAQEIWESEQPWVMLANPGWHVAHSKKVNGLTWYPNNGIHFNDLTPA
jgi:peptide/nickel transport system substrate-binding protein